MENFTHDNGRDQRLGFPEVIYGKSKMVRELTAILKQFKDSGQNALVTKLQKGKAKKLSSYFPNTYYDNSSGIFMLQSVAEKSNDFSVAVISAGTSDLSVVNEALLTLRFLGYAPQRFTDIGLSGIHRLMGKLDELKKYKVLVAVAGFEGLLPSVVGGLLPQPIIAVPTDTGYGVSGDGRTALFSMLSSCANGIAVMNINNGYGAAIAAHRILNLLQR